VESADVTSERSRGVHALALALVAIAALPKAQSPEETSLTWKGGVFELGAVQRSPPRPPLTEPGAANDRVVETIVASRLGDYYDYPLLSHAPVNIETNAEEGIAPDRFVASGESGIAEVVEGSTRTGKTLRRIIRGKRSVRYLKLRPGSNELGLAHEIHLVRATLDGTALPEAQPLTKTLKVLDGTQEAPIDLTAAYQDARRRFDVSWRSALVAVEPKIAAIKKELASRSQAWRGGGGFPNGGRFESTTDEHEALDPTFEWDAAAGKVTIHFSSRRSVSQKDVYVSANPALETFRCPPGHACAVPPPTVAVPNEQTYSVSLEGTYVFARSGALLSERTGEPAATIDTR